MIAILTNDGDGNDCIIAILSDKKYIDKYIKKETGFTPKGFVKYNISEYQDYWCKEFKESNKEVLIKV